MVELTLEYGNCSLSTGGYSMLSLAVAGQQLSPSFAYQVDQVAMALLVKYPCSTSVSIKAKIMHTFAMYSRHHLRDTIPFYEEAVKCGMHVGDFPYTVYAMIHKANALYRTCTPLKELVDHGHQVYDFVANKARFKDMAIMTAGVLYPAYALIGDSSVKPLLTTKDYEYLFNKNNPISSYNLTAAGWAAAGIMEGKYFEEQIDDAYEAGLVAQKMKRGLKGSLGMVLLTFYHSLAAIAKFDKTHDHKLLEEVKENQQFLGWWAENCHINGHHQYSLVQAEFMRVTGNAQEAMRYYETAISHAHQYNYLNVEALAYELYAKHMLAQGFKVLASNLFSKAVQVYTLWGAMVKVDILTSRYGNLMDSLQHKIPRTESISQQKHTDLDMMIVVRALQMLSQGVESNSLLERFVTLVVQSASAEKAAVVLKGDGVGGGSLLSSLGGFNKSQGDFAGTGEMKVAVFWDARTTDKPNVFSKRIPLAGYHELPSDIIQAVANTKQNVLIQNVSESDYNVRQADTAPTSSIMCLPIFHKTNEVVGVMYLEHSASGIFNRERLHMLELLCVQLGILLQNTSLYESMQGSMQMYELLAESLPQMIFCHRSADTAYYTNKLAQVYLGLTVDQLQLVFKYNFNETIHPDDYPDFIKAWTESFGKSVTLTAEFRVKRASDNTYRWCMMRSVPVLDRDGGTFIVSTASDVDDEHKAKERQLRISRIEASEKRYRLLSEAIPHIIWTATQNGAAIFFNSKWVEYTGISLDESHGFGWYHAIHPDDLDNVRKAWGAINTDRIDMKIRLRKWDGEYRWHLSRAIPCYEENTTNLVWFGTSTDINDTEVASELLIKARETAEKAAANQALFLANMSHEIRTPLSGLTGMLDLLTDTALNPEQHDYVDTMHHSAEGLLCIINDILDFSKIEAGKLQLQNEPFSPESAIEVVCEILSVMAATKDIELVFTVQPNVPSLLYGDPLRLRQVLMNLVGNAIKFTKTGEVAVDCSLMERYEDSTALLFTVEDTGCGMNPDEQRLLFNAFYQVDPSITRTHGGTGLGLAICKRLVDLFNGTISVNSTKGVGSKFSFSANFKNVKDVPPKPPAPRHKHTLNILSVADTPCIRKVIRFHMQQHVEGLTIINQEAYNLGQVKDILKKSTKTLQKFIVDVKYEQLPEVVSTIKAYIESNSSPPSTPSSPPKTPYFSPPRTPQTPQTPLVSTPNTPNFPLPNPFLSGSLSNVSSSSSVSSSSLASVPAIIIVTTSLKRSQYVKICADVLQGCHAQLRTLIKPITHNKLRVALATSPAELAAAGGVEGVGVEEVDIAQSPPPVPRAPSFDKKNKAPILIVEDNEVNQKVIRRHVEKWGMKCEVASNGAEAVKLVTQDRPPNFYCLALMDLFMPNVDGFEATRIIREWEQDRAPGTLTYTTLPPPSSVSPPPFSPPRSSSPTPMSPVSSGSPSRNGSSHSSEHEETEAGKEKETDKDVSMPRANSGTNLKRHNSTGNRLPIVVLTANVVGDIQEKIFQCGADAMLSKPIDFQKLRALVVHYSYISM